MAKKLTRRFECLEFGAYIFYCYKETKTLHRFKKPAIIYFDGSIAFYLKNQYVKGITP